MRDKNFITTNITNDIVMLQLEVNQTPKFSIDKVKEIIKYGDKNDYPEYLIYLYQNNPIHQAIVNTKAKYIAGTDIKSDNDWLKYANPFENWHEVIAKLALDKVNFGGFAVQVKTNALGQPIQFFHMDFGKLRVDENFEGVWYSDDWSARLVNKSWFPLYQDGVKGDSIYYFKNYQPSINKVKGAYPLPEFVGCTLDIDTDIEISSWCNNYTKNGFSATSLITIFNGEPKPDEKRNIAERLKNAHTGSQNAGKFVLAFAPKDGKAAEISSLQTTDLYQQFQEITKRNAQSIITGHQFTPILAGIQTEGQMANSSGSDMIVAEERFINGYVKTNQVPFINMLKKFYKAAKGQDTEFEFEQVKQAGYELPIENANIMGALTKDEIRSFISDKYGLKLTLAPVTNQPATDIQQAEVNDNLKGLSAAENADVLRIVRDFNKGRMNEHLALTRLMAYGLSEDKCRKILGLEPLSIQQSAQERFLMYVSENLVDVSDEDEILDTKLMGCSHSVKMASDTPNADVKNAILQSLKGNPYLTEEELSQVTGYAKDVITATLSWLIAKKLIESGGGNFMPTEKAFGKDTTEFESEIYQVFYYDKSPDAPANEPVIKSTTRDFCRSLYAMANKYNGKRLKPESIQKMTNEFGDNVWDFRGGFYHNPKTNETTPWCRHVWVMETRIKRKK